MQPETARQCMREIGVSRENLEVVASLITSSWKDEAKTKNTDRYNQVYIIDYRYCVSC